jgi:hypothetical protein
MYFRSGIKQKPALYKRARVREGFKDFKSGGSLHIWSFCTANDQFATEKLFVVKLLNGTPSFLNGRHLNKREAFGALRIFVANDLGVANLADTIEKFEKIAFCSVER